jgi:predicted dehydrogenase
MTKIRAAVIGAGSWATMAHLPILSQREEVEIVAICRKGDDLLKKLQSEYNVKVATEDYRDVIALEPDIVVVSSPSGLHFEHAAAALTAGAHVLCEKPMTIKAHDAWSLSELAKKVDRELLVSFGWNYMPIVQDTYKLLQKRGIGKLEQMSIQMASQTRELLSNTGAYPDASPEQIPEQGTWTNPMMSGGGYGQAQLSHALGLAFRLEPQRVAEAFAFMSAPLDAPVELHDAIVYKFVDGAVGTMAGGSSHMGAWKNKHEIEVRAIGSEGQFLIDLHRECVYIWYSDGTEINIQLPPEAGLYNFFGPANALVDVALGKREANMAPGELGALTVEALEMAYKSATSGTVARR